MRPAGMFVLLPMTIMAIASQSATASPHHAHASHHASHAAKHHSEHHSARPHVSHSEHHGTKSHAAHSKAHAPAEHAVLPHPIETSMKAFNPVSVDRHKTRIFLPLHNASIHKREVKVASWQMELSGSGFGPYSLERGVDSGALHHVRIQSFEGKTYVHADWRYATPVDVTVHPNGVEIVFYHEHAEAHFRTVAAGVGYWEGQRWSGGGPMRVRVLRLDPKKVKLDPAIASAYPNHMGLAPVSAMAKGHGAIAAVNGGYFSPRTGEPQGAVVINRTLVSRTMLDRPSLWIKHDGSAYIKVEKPSATVRLDDGTQLTCQAVNERPRRDRVTLYTSEYGHSTRTYPDPSRWEYAVTKGGLVVDQGYGNLPIPRGGYVLSGQGHGCTQLRDMIGYGQEIALDYSFNAQIEDAIGGGPRLLQGGRVVDIPVAQRFQRDVTAFRQPRTAIGITHDGKYMLVCIDGRHPGYSVGATLKELAYTMKSLGAVDALNLDGGGSATMWLRGKTINHPSDGHERAVSTALLVVPRDRQVASALDNLFAAGLHY